MYYAQFEAQTNTSSKVIWSIHYDRTVDVEYYYESMDVRGNVLRLDRNTGHLSIEREFTTYFVIGSGLYESVSEYIIYGSKVLEIVKMLEHDRIIFEYIEHKLDRNIFDVDEHANTGKFIEKIYSGSNFPSNGYYGGKWYVAGKSSDSPLVYNMRSGGKYSKIVNVDNVDGTLDKEFEVRWIAGKTSSNIHYIQWNKDGDFSDGKWEEIRMNNYQEIDYDSYHRKATFPTDSLPSGEEIYMRFMELDSNNNRTYDIGWVTFDEYGELEPPRLTSPAEDTDINGKFKKFRVSWSVPFSEPDAELTKTLIKARVRRVTGSVSGWREFEVYGNVKVWENKDFSDWVNGIVGIAPAEIEMTFQAEDNYGRKSNVSRRYSFYYSPEEFRMDYLFDGEEDVVDGKRHLYVTRNNRELTLKFPLAPSGTFHNEVRTYVELRNETTGKILERRTVELNEGNPSFYIVDESYFTSYDKEINTRDKYSVTLNAPRIDDGITSKSQKFFLSIEPIEPTYLSWKAVKENDRLRIEFGREALARNRETFKVLRYDYETDSIYELGESKGENIYDYTPHPKGSKYIVLSVLENGTFRVAGEQVIESPIEVKYPEILNMTDGTLTRVRDVIVTDTDSSPVKSTHYMAGRGKRLVEYGTHVDRKLSLSWLVDTLDELDTYLERFKPTDVLHYRDKEGRHLFISVDDIRVKESYNRLRWEMSMSAIEVEGLRPHTGIFYNWKGEKVVLFEEERGKFN